MVWLVTKPEQPPINTSGASSAIRIRTLFLLEFTLRSRQNSPVVDSRPRIFKPLQTPTVQRIGSNVGGGYWWMV